MARVGVDGTIAKELEAVEELGEGHGAGPLLVGWETQVRGT